VYRPEDAFHVLGIDTASSEVRPARVAGLPTRSPNTRTHAHTLASAHAHTRKRTRVQAEPDVRAAAMPAAGEYVAFDPFDPDFDRYPGARNGTMFEAVLGEGELIFVPSGAPHAAVNLDPTVALGVNYVCVPSVTLLHWGLNVAICP
jgi:hypothetical protein